MTDLSDMTTRNRTDLTPMAEIPLQAPGRTLAEWVAFGVSCLILAALIGSILLSWASNRNNPPALSVEAGPVRIAEEQYYVPFIVANTGGEGVEAIQVVAKLQNGEETDRAEMGEQTIDSLSGGDAEQGSFVFSQDPREGDLTLRVASYRVAGVAQAATAEDRSID